jgi:hypothetical protein
MESDYDLTEIRTSDRYVEVAPTLNGFESVVLGNSFALLFGEDWTNGLKREIIQKSFTSLDEVSRLRHPKMVFLHVLALHRPFLFDQNGRPLAEDVPDEQAYVEQLQYINQLVGTAVNTILANSPSEPIIILQGDHAPHDFGITKDEPCTPSHYAILNAIYFPKANRAGFYESMTPVNTFRVVFDTFFGANLARLADKSYLTVGSFSIDFANGASDAQSCVLSLE